MSHLQTDRPAVVLAPMEGVADAPMRALLTELGGFDLCVSEFLRISQQVPPAAVYQRHMPELAQGWCTPGGTPMALQLLGGDPERMALAAARGVALGATAIDINFGCPARTVNRHDGGAALLRAPTRIRSIVSAVRAAVPQAIPVSAKLRLGWDDPRDIEANSDAAAEGGASHLTIHGRTKAQGYRPPALWGPIGAIRRRLGIVVVANGDIFDVAAARRCVEETGCYHLMLGRGAVARPQLAQAVGRMLRGETQDTAPETLEAARGHWPHWVRRLAALDATWGPHATDRLLPGRIKQWAKMAHLYGSHSPYEAIKRSTTMAELCAHLTAWATAPTEASVRGCGALGLGGPHAAEHAPHEAVI